MPPVLWRRGLLFYAARSVRGCPRCGVLWQSYLMSPSAKTRLMCAIVLAFIVGLVIVIPGVPVASSWLKDNVWERRYPNRTQGWRGIDIRSVYDGDKLIYAFATTHSTIPHGTNDPQGKPPDEGIFWIWNQRDGLWVDGTKVSIPNGYKVIAIREDRTIVPVKVTQIELDCLSRQFGRITGLPELEARLAAALELPASGPSSIEPEPMRKPK